MVNPSMTPAQGNALVQRAYRRLAGVYDRIFGAILQPGRRRAIAAIPQDEGLRILEVGIGTGLTVPLYRPGQRVIGLDYSADMLAQAARRVRETRATGVALLRGDAAGLPFAEGTFDVVVAPHVISVVPDPGAVGAELRRVCKPGGRIILLNHFKSANPMWAPIERWLSPVMFRLGFRTDICLRTLLTVMAVKPLRISRVNAPPLWKLVICRRP